MPPKNKAGTGQTKLFGFGFKAERRENKEAQAKPAPPPAAVAAASPREAGEKPKSPPKKRSPPKEKEEKRPPVQKEAEKEKKPPAKKRTPAKEKEEKTKPAPKKAVAAADPDGAATAAEEPPKAKRNFYFRGKANYDNSALNKGSKPSPDGDDTCLDGKTFIVTGRLESFDRADAETLIKRHGGAIRTGVTKRLSYLVVGAEPGESKIAKAKELGTAVLTEDGLIALVADASVKKGIDPWRHLSAIDRDRWGGCMDGAPEPPPPTKPAATVSPRTKKTPPKKKKRSGSASSSEAEGKKRPKTRAPKAAAPCPDGAPTSGAGLQEEEPLWADKYAPKNSTQVLGNAGKAAELKAWLRDWEQNAKNYNPKVKSEWKSGVLISGPPGIGKTTTSNLVARECGYDVVEMNASDQRSQKTLRERVSSAIGTGSVMSMMANTSAPAKKLLIMDEIGGLDRGGTTEIIAMLKQAKTPIICICNDKYSQKLKSLATYLKDMTFARPPKNLVASYLKKVLREHEGVDLHEMALTEVVEAAGNDLRSTLNNLQMWSKTANHLGYEALKRSHQTAMKDADMSPFQSAQRLFNRNLTWGETQSLFFDNDLQGLFVQENYIYSGGREGAARMETMMRASSALAYSDRLERLIRQGNNWSLGTSQAFFASYYPLKLLGRQPLCSYLPPAAQQHLPCFPSYMGKLSTMNKNIRLSSALAREVNSVGEGAMLGSRRDVVLEYLPVLRRKVEGAAAGGDAAGAAAMLAEYNMCKSDWDFVLEVDTFKKLRGKLEHPSIDTKTKSAMTRTLNKLKDAAAIKQHRGNTIAPTASLAVESDEEASEEEDAQAILPKPAAKKASRKPSAKSAAKRPATERKAPVAKKRAGGRHNTK